MDRILLNRIKEIRTELNLTVRDLAEKCELSHSTISDLENGKSIPCQISLMLVSKGLNKNVCEVFILDTDALDVYFGRNTDQRQ